MKDYPDTILKFICGTCGEFFTELDCCEDKE